MISECFTKAVFEETMLEETMLEETILEEAMLEEMFLICSFQSKVLSIYVPRYLVILCKFKVNSLSHQLTHRQFFHYFM